MSGPWEQFAAPSTPPASPDPAGGSGGAAPWEQFAAPATPDPSRPTIPGVGDTRVDGTPIGIPSDHPEQKPLAGPANPNILDHIRGGVQAGLNLVAQLAGGVVGMVGGEAVTGAQMANTGVKTGLKAAHLLPQDTPIPETPSLMQNMGTVGDSATRVLKNAASRALPGTFDTDENGNAVDSKLGDEYTDKYVQPVMEGTQALSGHLAEAGAVHEMAKPAADQARAAAAPVVAKAGAAAAKGTAKMIGVDPELAKVAQTAGDLKYPIDVRPDQVVGNAKFSRLAGQAAADVPLANSKTHANQVAFTRNVIDALNPEETADRLTPQTFSDAMDRSGKGIGDIMAKTDVPLDAEMRTGLDDLAENVNRKGTDADKKILNAYIDEVKSKAGDDGVIDGTALREINSEIGRRARTEVGNDLGTRLNDLQGVIEDAVQKNVDPADGAALKDFRRQYAYGKILEPMVAKSIDGKVSPAALMGAATRTSLGKHLMAMGKGGPLGDLAKVGQLIKEPGSSGTAERHLVYGAGLGGLAAVEPHTAAASYGAALGYNTLGPKLTRAMVGKRAKPPLPEPPAEPTTSPGAGGGGGGGPAPKGPGPLGDLTPDWSTTPGAGGGKPRGGHEPGFVRPVDEPSPTTGRNPRRAGADVPAVPGRPDLPDTLVSGGPAETAASERSNTAMGEPGAVEARRVQGLPAEMPATDPVLAETDRLAAEHESPAVRKVLQDHASKLKAAETEKAAQVVREHDADALERAARDTTDSALQARLLKQADNLRGTEKIPTGKVIEGQPPIKEPATPAKIPTGKATEITPEHIEADRAWRADFKLGEEDAARARKVAEALGHDEKAVVAAVRQHEHQPQAFDRAIAKINDEGEARANESKLAAGGGEGGADAAEASGAPVRSSDGGAPVRGEQGDGPVPAARSGAAGVAEPEPTAAIRPADQLAGADRVPEAGHRQGAGAETSGRRAAPRAEGPGDVADRRSDAGERKRVADMSPDDMRAALHTDELTGLRNGRWLAENKDDFSHTVAFDADSLKWVNDNMGHAAGDTMLQAWGDALRQATENAARNGGDEFFALAKSEGEAHAIAAKVKQSLDSAVITAETPDGKTVTIKGLGMSFGVGAEKGAADAKLIEHKAAREASGERAARGEQPPNTTRGLAAGERDPLDSDQRQDVQGAGGQPRAAGAGLDGTDTQPHDQPGGVRQEAGEKGVPKDGGAEELFHLQNEEAKTFYSPLSRGLEASKQGKASAEQWAGILKNMKGVKPEELEWSGVNDWLKAQGGAVTKDQLQAFLKDGGVQVHEVTKGEQAMSPEMKEWTGGSGNQVPQTANAWQNLADMFESQARSRDELGKPSEKFWRLSNEATEMSERLETDSGKVHGAPRYSQYQLPGGTNYREVLLTLPAKSVDTTGWTAHELRPKSPVTGKPEYQILDKSGNVMQVVRTAADGAEALEVAKKVADRGQTPGTAPTGNYKSPHWDEPNVLAHIRLNDRTDAEGRKVLFVEELQSDWAQQGKKRGFDEGVKPEPRVYQVQPGEHGRLIMSMREQAKDHMVAHGLDAPSAARVASRMGDRELAEMTRREPEYMDLIHRGNLDAAAENERARGSNLPPKAPFVGNTSAWTALAIKRIAKMASDEGYDRVAFVNGEQSAARYDLSKHIDRIDHNKNADGTFNISAIKDGSEVFSKENMTGDELADHVGKDVAQKIIDGEGKEPSESAVRWQPEDTDEQFPKSLSGLDLKVGGEGMKAFYDKIVPNVAKDVVRKLGGDGLTNVPLNIMDEESDSGTFRRSQQNGFDITPKMREQASGGVPLFKAGDVEKVPVSSAEGLDKALRDKFGDKLIDGLQQQGLLKYAKVVDEQPEGPRRKMGALFRQSQDATKAQATLYYDKLSAEQAPSVLMHELGEHFGIVRLLGQERYMVMLNDLSKLKSTPEVKEAWAHVEKNYVGPDTASNLTTDHPSFLREVAARLVEDHPDLPFVRRLINEIRAFFYEKFGTTMVNKVDANLIRGLAASALRKAGRGELPMVPKGHKGPAAPPAAAPPAKTFKPMVAKPAPIGRVQPRTDGFPPIPAA